MNMGDSLGDVRIHTGPVAANACEDISARAFTVGNHVAFNRGEYDPESPEGQHVLVHELAHVRQQTAGAVSMLPQEGELRIDPDERLEREAEETAERVLSSDELGIRRMSDTGIHIQRYPGEGLVTKAGDLVGNGTDKVDDATAKKYRLTKDQIVDLATSVETPKGVAEYIEHHDIDVASRIQDSASSPVKGMAKGYAYAGPAGVPIGAVLTTTFGEQAAGKIQKLIRKVLDLDTNQELNLDSDTRSSRFEEE